MNKLIPTNIPPIPENWDYGESVNKVKTMVYKWKNLSIEMLNELYVAREMLSVSQSEAAQIMHGTKVPCKTWSQYCEDIGSSRRVVNRWLANAFPEQKEIEDKDPAASMFKPTKNGYPYFECISALQKAIRRGEEEETIYWAVELYISGNSEALWRRLKVIAVEDIGLAVEHMPILIDTLYSHFCDLKSENKKDEPERMPFLQAVLALVRAPKSRLVCWAVNAVFPSHAGGRAIPDYAKDRHTLAGKRLGRGWEHFETEGAKLINHIELAGEQDYQKQAMNLLKKEK